MAAPAAIFVVGWLLFSCHCDAPHITPAAGHSTLLLASRARYRKFVKGGTTAVGNTKASRLASILLPELDDVFVDVSLLPSSFLQNGTDGPLDDPSVSMRNV